MQVTILNVSISHVPNAKGGYYVADVAYKDDKGATLGKKVMSFTVPEVYNVLSEAKNGDVFEVNAVKEAGKDGKEYWQWKSIGRVSGKPSSSSWESPSVSGTKSPRITYETPEERAKKQIYIVRQSSVSSAIDLLAANGGKKNTKEEVVELAKYFEAYVFGDDGSVFSMKEDIPFETE